MSENEYLNLKKGNTSAGYDKYVQRMNKANSQVDWNKSTRIRSNEVKNKKKYTQGVRSGRITGSYDDYQKSQAEYGRTHGIQNRRVKVENAPLRKDYGSFAEWQSAKRQFDAGTLYTTAPAQNVGTGQITGTYAGNTAQIYGDTPKTQKPEEISATKRMKNEQLSRFEKATGYTLTPLERDRFFKDPTIFWDKKSSFAKKGKLTPTEVSDKAEETPTTNIISEVATDIENEKKQEVSKTQETINSLLGVKEVPTAEDLRSEFESSEAE